MKKMLTAITTSLVLASAVYAGSSPKVGLVSDMGLGVGAQFNGKINAFIGNNGISGDYLFLNNQKFIDSRVVTWYVGAGLGYHFNNNIGLRVPVGFDWNFHKKFDAFLQATPTLNVGDSIGFGVGTAIGVRYQF